MAWFCIHALSHYFQTFVKTYYLLLDFFKACQSDLIKNIKPWICNSITSTLENMIFLAFSFITATIHDVLDKNKYQQNTFLSTYFSVDHWVRLSWKR